MKNVTLVNRETKQMVTVDIAEITYFDYITEDGTRYSRDEYYITTVVVRA